MFRKIILFVLALGAYFIAPAQTKISVPLPADTSATSAHSHLRISLITCGMGVLSWQTFGHTCIRIIDSAKTDYHRDLIYNYGTFDGFDENFEYKFLKGTLIYFLNVLPYKGFIREFEVTGRSVDEQVFLLDDAQKENLRARLDDNALLKNREYQYDVFLDNCSTRIRDMLSSSLGSGLVYGNAFPPDVHVTVRTVYNQYYRNRYWERVALNIFLGCINDKPITNKYIMFIPDFLSICVGGATVNGKPLCNGKIAVLEDHVNFPSRTNDPLIVACLLALLTIVGLSYQKLRFVGKLMTTVMLLSSGILGCLILFFWMGTSHSGCTGNFNLLWALPTNILLVFFKFKGRRMYALIGMLLLLVSLLLHILKVQVMPLFELWPYLLALLYTYGYIYKNGQDNTAPTPVPITVKKAGNKAGK